MAALLFSIAIFTDLADGRVARSLGQATPLGGLIDHATDATFVSLILAALAHQGAVPSVLPVLVILAFVQYVVDSKGLAGQPLRSSSLGRWNGIAYFVLAAIPIFARAFSLSWPPDSLVRTLGWVLVITTSLSIAERARALFKR